MRGSTCSLTFAVLGVFSLGYGSKAISLGKVADIFAKIGKKVVVNAGEFNSALTTAKKVAKEATKLGFTSKGIKVYSKIRSSAVSLPPKLRIKRVKEGTDPKKIAIIGRSMGNDSGLVGVNDVAKHFEANGIKVNTFTPSDLAFDDFDTKLAAYRLEIGDRFAELPDHIQKNTLGYLENVEWVNRLKQENFTFIDIGNPNNLTVSSVFYDMEILNIFK